MFPTICTPKCVHGYDNYRNLKSYVIESLVYFGIGLCSRLAVLGTWMTHVFYLACYAPDGLCTPCAFNRRLDHIHALKNLYPLYYLSFTKVVSHFLVEWDMPL